MGELQIWVWLREHLGTVGSIAGIIIFLAVRFAPTWLAAWKEQRLEALRARLAEKQEYTSREHELFARLDRKDATLEKITGNHIQHLELQLAQSKEFFDAAVKNLNALNETQERIAAELRELRAESREIKSNTDFLRGSLS